MPPKRIKLGKKDDITLAVKQIRSSRDREIIFELESGSLMLKNSDNLKLLKRTGEAMGKKILIETEDDVGKVLAKKAGVLAGGIAVAMPRPLRSKVTRSDVKPNFSDIGRTRPKPARPGATEPAKKVTAFRAVREPETDRPAKKIRSRLSRKYLWIIAGVILAFFAVAVLLPQATVTVLARSEPISRDLEITVDTKATSVDSANLVIPATPVTREVSQTKNFPTTGTQASGTKALGTVQIYNFTPYTLTLKAATTTLVANGKKYFFTKDVTGIRATAKTGSQINEATTTGPIQIVAESAGADYNLDANTQFQIVNEALGNQNVYAVNKAALSGGSSDQTKKILSTDDIQTARSALTDEILSEAEADLSSETGQPMKVINTGVRTEVLADTANKDVGTETDNFDMTLIAKVTGVAFNENDVASLVIGKINEVLSSDKYLVEDADSEYTATFKNLDIPAGRGVLSVHFETIAAYKLDDSNLSKILAGKTESEIREILLSKPEVDSVKVDFWPAWLVHKAPRWNGRINIKTVLSQ